ncbi:hypothetical protein FGLOB1_2867 [Fusarium globosum]|uniref:Zn(2)-C6 fungal-type domain-containing protein n=1 Tax=Fusarium globosum TaxID=78864 RepID=A0A8H6DGK6_9HYPO|nr:hypothetical protein FGLOB1_2867 [Fusarium globosum]
MLLRDALKRHWGICKIEETKGLQSLRPSEARLRSQCALHSTASAVSEDLSRPETNIIYRQELSNGAVQEAGAIPVGLNDFIDYSLEWLRCESLPLQVLDFAVWNNIPGGYLHPERYLDQATSRKRLVLPFLKRFTESSGIADGFDCGTVAQRRQLNETVGDSPCQTLAAKTREIVSMMKRSMTRTRLCSDAGIEWSPVVEKACLDFFSPRNLHRFLRLFWSGWYPNSPIIHKPTFNTEAEPPGLIASMTVLGACLSPDSDDCVRAMAWLTPVEEAVFADDILYDDSIIASSQLVGDESVVWDKLKALHAAYFICIAQNWEGSKEGRQRVRKDRYSRIVSIARSFGLYNLSMEKLDTTFPTQQKWAKFILLESMIRSFNMFTIISALCCLVFQYQTTLIDASQITPAATGLNRWIWLWQRGGHVAVDSDNYSIEDMWKRVGFMQHADEYYHLACAMLEQWKLTEKQIGDTLAAWAAPLGPAELRERAGTRCLTIYGSQQEKPKRQVLTRSLTANPHDLKNPSTTNLMSRERPRVLLRASHPRHRKGLPKARTGCMTCRIRKIKCDEARPGCQRCIGTGRKCDGYGDTDTVTQQTLIIRERQPITRALNNNLGEELSFHAFDYYRGHVSHHVGDTVDSDFWGNLVLRLAPTDPAIRHAISAISLMYAEKTKDTRDPCPNYRPAIVEYNKAISAVRSWPLATESRVKPLLVCLLFVCIEFMLGHEHQNAAKMHILQGRRLLANIKDRKTPETDIVRQYLAPIYLRLAYVGNDRVDFPRHLLQMTTAPLKFASLADARCVLYYLIDIGFTLIYDVKSYRSNGISETPDTEGEALQSRYKHIAHELANWRHAFEAYLAFSDLDRPDTRTAKLLTQRHCLMLVFLDSMVSGSDYVCDRNSLSEFSIAADCATFTVKYDNEIMQGPSFTFESEVVGPVYWIAAKCRQPAIRRRALELLYEREKANRVESLTIVKHTIAMAKRVIEIEEEGLEIPKGTRPIQDYPNKYEILLREESSEWAEGFLTDQKEQWPVLWDLGSHCSDIPTKLTGIAAAREQRELSEGLAKGWPRERLVWPYGITRERRVLSVVVKKHTANDLWLEYPICQNKAVQALFPNGSGEHHYQSRF